MDLAELQLTIASEGQRNYAAKYGSLAGTSVEQDLADVVRTFKAKHPHSPSLVANPAAIGPLEAAALAQIEACRRVVRADQTSTRGIHKLPTYVVGGRS